MRSNVSVLLAVGTILLSGNTTLAEPTETETVVEESGIAFRGEGFLGFSVIDEAANSSALEDSSSEAFIGGGSASMAVSLGGFFGQLDAFGSDLSFDEDRLAVHGGGGHFGWRDIERGTLGVGGSYNEVELENLHSWRAALEGELFLDRFTVGGSGGVFSSENADSDNADRTDIYLQATAAFYPAPDTRFHFSAGGHGIETNNAVAILGAGLELMANAEVSPISVFLRWEGAFGESSDFDTSFNSMMFGMRVYWGAEAPSLMAYDRGYFKDSCIGVLVDGRLC